MPGSHSIYKEGTRRSILGVEGHPEGGRALPLPPRGEMLPHGARCLIGLSCDCFAFFR